MADTILRYESAQELEIVEANADSVFFTVQDRDDGSRNLWVANSDEVTQIETPSGELGDAGQQAVDHGVGVGAGRPKKSWMRPCW